jgi:hypothetical protein
MPVPLRSSLRGARVSAGVRAAATHARQTLSPPKDAQNAAHGRAPFALRRRRRRVGLAQEVVRRLAARLALLKQHIRLHSARAAADGRVPGTFE